TEVNLQPDQTALQQPASQNEQLALENHALDVFRLELHKTELRPMALADVLQLALTQNPTLKVAADTTRQYKAQYIDSLAHFLPDVGVSYTFGNYDGMVQGLDNTMYHVKHDTRTPQLFFKYNLLQGGAQFFLARYAKNSLDAQRLNEQAGTQDILHET